MSQCEAYFSRDISEADLLLSWGPQGNVNFWLLAIPRECLRKCSNLPFGFQYLVPILRGLWVPSTSTCCSPIVACGILRMCLN